MASLASTLKRTIASLALVGAAAVAAFGAPAAHAGAPVIAVKVVQYATELQVTGSGFGAGDPVAVIAVNNDTHKVETMTQTTASIAHIVCWNGACFYMPGGRISATTPPVYIHCGFAFVTVYAIDQKTSAHSNYVQATLGAGPC